MKNRFKTHKRKRKRQPKMLFFLSLFVLSLYYSFIKLDNSKITLDDKFIAKMLVNYSFNNKIIDNEENFIKKITPTMFFQNNYYKLQKKEVPVVKEEEPPLIYIYNSHQTEEYRETLLSDFSLQPTVMVADYILQDIFNTNNLPTIIEEQSIKEILNQNNWRYYYSYDASRIFLEDAKKNNPSLKYFIDVHRDSLEYDRTTIAIDGKSYAKTIFLIGLENPGYEGNLEFTERLNNKMNEKYPGLSKGIYKKGGEGVNGVYNQDFSNRVILIEVGGYENSLTEVLNSVLAFSECFMEVINEEI